jgi:protein SCO1/2
MRQTLILVFLVLFTACSETPPPFKSTVVPPVEWGGNFVMTAQDGKRFDTATLAGKVQVLFFGFTHCPDICAPTLARLAQVMKALGPDSSRVQVLFVSVDPEHDTPAQLKKYLAGFDSSFIGLTGSVGESLTVQRDHKIFSEAEEQTITHTSSVMVKDKKGKLRLVMNESLSVQDMAHDLRLLINQ